jgi:excisionase family DNA binding protein
MSDAITLTSPWWRTEQAAAYVQTSKKILYGEVKAGRLRAAKIAGRRELRFRKNI